MVKLKSKQRRDLLSAFKIIKGKDQPILTKKDITEFIDSIFADHVKLELAWRTPGFPFIGLNELYKFLNKADHPVFLDLFGSSFIAGTFHEEPQTEPAGRGHNRNFSAAAIQCLTFSGG